MPKREPVFELVKSLSTAERRNLMRLTKTQTGRKDYIRLLEKLEKMKEYDEEAIQRLRIRSLSFTKNYLFNYILKALNYYDDGEETEIANGFRSINYLAERRLFNSALKLSNSLRKKAEKRELFDDIARILHMQLEITAEIQDMKFLEKNLQSIGDDLSRVNQMRENLTEIKKLSHDFFLKSKTTFIARGEKDLKAIEALEKNPLIKNPAKADSRRAQYEILELRHHLAVFRGDMKKAEKFSRDLLDLFKQAKFLTEENPVRKIRVLSRLAAIASQANDTKECRKLLSELDRFKPKTPREHVEQFDKYYTVLLGYASDYGDAKFASKKIEYIESQVSKVIEHLPGSREILFYFLLGRYYLVAGDPKKATQWLRKIIDMKRTEIRTDIQSFARIMNLLAHLELKDKSELIDHYLDSTKRYLENRDHLYKLEGRILKFVRKMNKKALQEDLTPAYQDLKKDLDKIFKDDYENRAQYYFDFTSWLESRISGESLLSIVQQKASS